MMKIAIITQPLISNYGGLLQNWALQQALKKINSEWKVITFDQVDSVAPLYLRLGSRVKQMFGLKKRTNFLNSFELFRTTYINATTKAKSLRDFKRFDRLYKPDAYITGSDQVWRPRMTNILSANFLGFTQCPIKLAYAASFGTDNWEFSEEETAISKRLIGQFKGISVREDSGVTLCQTYLNKKAEHLLDPTLLLEPNDYKSLLAEEEILTTPYIFTYILDTSSEKQAIVKSIIGQEVENNACYDANGHLPKVRMSVEQWIKGIIYSDLVVCDSFHGVAFSIIFNKDFIVLNNPERGNTRIESILRQFDLTDRLINCTRENALVKPIDWERINKRRKELKIKSINFIKANLCQ